MKFVNLIRQFSGQPQSLSGENGLNSTIPSLNLCLFFIFLNNHSFKIGRIVNTLLRGVPNLFALYSCFKWLVCLQLHLLTAGASCRAKKASFTPPPRPPTHLDTTAQTPFLALGSLILIHHRVSQYKNLLSADKGLTVHGCREQDEDSSHIKKKLKRRGKLLSNKQIYFCTPWRTKSKDKKKAPNGIVYIYLYVLYTHQPLH